MRLSIRAKLMCAAILIMIAMAIVGWQGLVGRRNINKELNAIKTRQFGPALMMANTNVALISWKQAELDHVLAKNIQKVDEYERIILEQKKTALEFLQKLSDIDHLPESGNETVRKLRNDLSRTDPVRDRVAALSREGRREEARELIYTELWPIIDEMDVAMTEFLRLQEIQLDDTLSAADERYFQSLKRISLVLGIAFVASILICFFVSAVVMKGVDELVQGAKLAAAGDFAHAKVAITSKDEFGYLGMVFNEMLDSLEDNLVERKQTEEQLREQAVHLEALVKARAKELRDAQEQLIRKEKLAIIGQLASGISHELRNPLGVIGNSVYYLNMKVKDADEKVKRHLAILKWEVQRANEIITELLDFAKTKSPAFVEANVLDVVEDALAGIEIPEGIAVEIDFDGDLPPILMDYGQIRRVFLNILSNAVGAMPEGGRLKIEKGVQNDFVEIIFRDTGEGIGKENLAKIFEPLFTTKAKGIGLGLAVVKGIVDGHKGGIEVESEIGMGTTFAVKLPLQRKEVVRDGSESQNTYCGR